MTQGQCITDGSKLAAADLRTKQYYAVKIDSNGKVALGATAGEMGYGILRNKPNTGEAAEVATEGETEAILAGTTDEGDLLAIDANGKLAVTTDHSSSILAIAVASGVAGDIKRVKLLKLRRGLQSFACWYINLASVSGAGNIVTGWVPGFAGKIASAEFFTMVPVTTGSKAFTINFEIDTVDATGGTVALTSATCTPLGARIASSAFTAGNTFTSTSVIDIEAASVTAFAEGTGMLIVHLE